jgi:hypothetical protein
MAYAIMGQRDHNIKFLVEISKTKGDLIKKGLVADDDAVYFGWGVEQGHLGKTEIFIGETGHPDSKKAIEEWTKESNMKALDGCYFLPGGVPLDELGPRVSNYHLWLRKLYQAFDPNGVAADVSLTGPTPTDESE